MKTKAVILLVVFALCALSFAGCGERESELIDPEIANKTIVRFFKAVKADDYAEATALLHRSSALDVEKFISGAESAYRLDFNSDMIIHSITEYDPAYPKTHGYSDQRYFSADMTVGGASLEARFEIVKNSEGYGIRDIHLTVHK